MKLAMEAMERDEQPSSSSNSKPKPGKSRPGEFPAALDGAMILA
jgi:hypothetical protein